MKDRIAELEAALRSLAGCMPNVVYIYGAYGEMWSEDAPDQDLAEEYETVDFPALLER